MNAGAAGHGSPFYYDVGAFDQDKREMICLECHNCEGHPERSADKNGVLKSCRLNAAV
ncbi:hypothetical protein J7E26_08965 [Bacillus sp. ISL-51]|uniref:hypothetical protein n=1 Tax=Bacillus sp. ISL-51 TaxID=2819132 RepID=UPI001BECC459|nr:hypothetical protein [Bacillus sp. ISL-51]MBT2574082.1 hypothetical protein [Bacillus sp. ISL-51]